MKNILRFLAIFLFLLILLAISTLTIVDRSPYEESDYYMKTISRVDSLTTTIEELLPADSFQLGWASVDITPQQKLPMAGYGARDPKTFETIHDSVSIHAYVFDNELSRKALLSGELLIIHPELTQAFSKKIAASKWSLQDIYLTATHTHSSLGGWAPGLVGNLFAGAYDPEVVEELASKMYEALLSAENNLRTGKMGFMELEVPEYVKNRIIKKEIADKDPWLKLLMLESDSLKAIHSVYSAHATCLSQRFREISGDYPTPLNWKLLSDGTADFSSYSAGAVASMGPGDTGNREWEKATAIGYGLAGQIKFSSLLSPALTNELAMRSFRYKVSMHEPNFKISENLCVRPWVFKKLFGDYKAEISVLQLNDVLFIGTPSDFSGELALPLYKYARSKGLNLVITSFNGGYIGYIPKDEWYNLNKYETRTMAWYGPDNGAYYSELIKRTIDLCSQ